MFFVEKRLSQHAEVVISMAPSWTGFYCVPLSTQIICDAFKKRVRFTHLSERLRCLAALLIKYIWTFETRQQQVGHFRQKLCMTEWTMQWLQDQKKFSLSATVPHFYVNVISGGQKASTFLYVKFPVFIYLFFLFYFFLIFLCHGGILDRPKHLLTVISAPGADIDCQQDVSFLLFISSSLRDASECKSAFSPWRVGGAVVGWRTEGEWWWWGDMLGWDAVGGVQTWKDGGKALQEQVEGSEEW